MTVQSMQRDEQQDDQEDSVQDVSGAHSVPDDNAEALKGRTWVHESGYGGKDGKPRTSSDQRERAEQAFSGTPPVDGELPKEAK